MKAIRFIASVMIFICLLEPGGTAAASPRGQPAGSIYFVDRAHSQASDSNPGTEALPWKTIQHAADAAVAGDTIYVKAGTYPERVTPGHSGSQGKRITFQALPRRSVTMWGFYTLGSDFLTIEGFNITTDASLTGWTDIYGVFIHSNDVQVIDNYFFNLKAPAITGYWHDPYPQRAYVAHNTIYHSQMGIVVTGYDWVVEENVVSRLYNYGNGDSDYSRFFGNNHVIRWNHFYGSLPSEFGAAHVDCFQTFDNNGEFVNNVVFDGNLCSEFHQGLMGEGHYYHNISHITFKNNVFVHGWAWGLCVQDIPYLTAINNTFVDIAYHGIGLSGDSHHGTVKNNIFDGMETSYWFEDTSSIDGDYNLIYAAQSPKVKGPHDIIDVAPRFINPASDNYHLKSDSPAIDAGWATSLVAQDFDRIPRPQLKGWDIGAFEYQLPLVFGATPGNQTILLVWQVNITLLVSATWRIDFSPANGGQPSPVTGIANATRFYVLDGLTNYMLYTVTLTAVDGGSPIITATLQARPSDHLLILPVVFR